MLGPVEVRRDGRELPLGGPKQRALLAILLLNANEAVSRDRLIDGLWGERPPPTAAHTLDNYVSRLRKLLGGERIARRPPGYVLHLAAEELDLERFEHLLERGRDQVARGDPAEGAATLRSALALWRGPALADLLYEPFAATEAERLEQRRLAALEERIDAELASGRSRELIPELEALAAAHPFRERLLGQLVLALYRAGRQSDALANLQAARRRLAEELGLEPGPQLRELERQILVHDPALGPPLPKAKGIGRRRRRPIAAAVAGAAVAAGVTVAIVLVLNQTPASTGEAAGANQLLELDPSSARVAGASSLHDPPNALAASRESIWVADPDSAVVSRVSVSSRQVGDRIPVPGQPAKIAVGNGSVWVTNTLGGAVARIDPDTATVTQTIPLGGSLSAIAAGPRAIWVADAGEETLFRLDPETGTATQTISLPTPPSALAVGYGAVWVASHDGGTVTQIDSRVNSPLPPVPVGQGPAAITIGGGSVWVVNNLDGTVSRLDPSSGRVAATIPVGSGPVAAAFANGSLWVANKFSNSVSRIDPRTNAVAQTVRTRGRPTSLVAVGDRLWVGTRPAGDSHRGGTLTLLGFRPSIDPALNQLNYPPPQFLGLTTDTLVTFEHAPGPDGLQLVPDLALALPTPTHAGRVYAFRLRPGIHYSDGSPLRVSDFRRAIERLFRLGSPGAGNFTTLAGAARCVRAPAACDLSDSILATDATRTVTFRLARPDSQFLHKLALGFAAPVPPGTPNREVGAKPVPGTGPYRIVRSTPTETRFARNPRFHEWSHVAQPAGYPDAIVWRYNLAATAQAHAVERGRADWMFEQIPAKTRTAIAIHHPTRLRISPVFGTEFLQINTRRPPFDHRAVRRALNYAVDRAEVARLYGGRSLAAPTCQVLPPGLPGYQPYCPYTQHPSRTGRWTAPNLTRARALVAASATRGARVTVSSFNDDSAFHKRVARYIARVLRTLGYRARAQTTLPRNRIVKNVQLLPNTLFGGELGAGDFLRSSFACDAPESRGWFCDPQLDQLMRHASALEANDPQRAVAAWAAIDRKVVDAAGWVPLLTPREVELISARVRNYQYHPIWGALVDQFWIR